MEERAAVLVVGMEREQILVETEGAQFGRTGIGGFGLPGAEFLHRPERRGGGVDGEGIGRLRRRDDFHRIKLEGGVGDEVVQRRAVGVAQLALVEEVAENVHRDLAEGILVRQRLQEPLVDFGQDAGQVPGLEILARWLGGGAAPQEAPLVLPVVAEEPTGLQGAQDRARLGRRPPDLGVELLDRRIRAAFDPAFQDQPHGQRLGAFAPGLFAECRGLDGPELLGYGLGLVFGLGFFDLLPLRVTRAARRGDAHDG